MASVTAGNTGAEGSAASGNITLGAPASPATDDIWIACVHSSDQVAHTFTDWTQIVQANGGGTTSRLSVWYFRYAGSTPNLIVGHTAGQSPIGGIKAYVGCKNTGSPVNVAGTIAGGTDATIECSEITPTKPNCALLVITGAADDNALTALGGDYAVVFEDSGGGTQNCYQTAAGTPDGMVGLFHDLSVPASATGTITVTQAASDPWAGVLIALEPEQAALNAAAGSYALTGSAGTVVAGRMVEGTAGSYALTGSAATMLADRMVNAVAGSYALTGSAATLLRDALLNAGLGTYVLTGSAASLEHGYVIAALAGAYALAAPTGGGATLVQHTFVRSVGDVDSVSIAFVSNVTAGNTILVGAVDSTNDQPILATDVTDSLGHTYIRDAHLEGVGSRATCAALHVSAITGGANTVTLNVAGSSTYQDLGISEWSGMAANPVDGTGTGEADSATPTTSSFSPSGPCTILGVMAYNGGTTTMTAGATYTELDESEDNVNQPFSTIYKQVGAGTYTADWALGASSEHSCVAAAYLDAGGTGTTLLAQRLLAADAGAYGLTGSALTALLDRLLSADPGAYALTGVDLTTLVGRVLGADPGSYTLTGTDAALVAGRLLGLDPGSYGLTGLDAGVLAGRVLSGETGTYLLTGAGAGVTVGRVLSGDPGAYALDGAALGALVDRVLGADPGTYVVTGMDASPLAGYAMGADPGVYLISGADAALVAVVGGGGGNMANFYPIHRRRGRRGGAQR